MVVTEDAAGEDAVRAANRTAQPKSIEAGKKKQLHAHRCDARQRLLLPSLL